jgi:NACHT domain
MPLRTNAKSIKETLYDRLASDAELLSCGKEFFEFFNIASSGEPLTYGTGVLLICKGAAAAVKVASILIKRLSNSSDTATSAAQIYDRFRIVFYVACLEAYLNALQVALAPDELPKTKETRARNETKDAGAATNEFVTALKLHLSKVEEGEAPFLLGVDPLKGEVPLYSALGDWLLLVLAHYGYPDYQMRSIVGNINETARRNFNVFVASDSVEATWIRNYLLIAHQGSTGALATDLSSVRMALDNWLKARSNPTPLRAEAWESYRKTLLTLPDDKDSMYNETFGVREVFVEPEGTYAIKGGAGDAGRPQVIPDLGSVLGGLLSTRVSGDELIILCGGPGSGKSTLCRVLASELAKDPGIFPVFLRLRRLKEGSDIPAFLESYLYQKGIIDRISDLRALNNVVVILDGFDELVMASRARLRNFFNGLREDHTSGALQGIRIVVSGRDTLFPGGEGLPHGSHVLTLRPFDRLRVALWGEKWRVRHQSGGGATFFPETLLSDDPGGASPLKHLVTWPLTLHLVARVHTSGRLAISGEHTNDTTPVTKAILYRHILAETARRQQDQTAGQGRLEPDAMRKFLRELAWRMYKEGRDSMDLGDVLPALQAFFPQSSEADLSELADVAVVNAPEITKGEQTGFEFVHKSFAEYLAAEQIAFSIERVTFEAPEFGRAGLSWRMSEGEAAREVALFAAIRLLTDEIQEMLEPMLGDYAGFGCNEGVSSMETRQKGLERIIKRFEGLLDGILGGRLVRIVEECSASAPQVRSPFEAYGNFAACIVFIGSASARILKSQIATETAAFFSLQVFDGAFWRLLFLLHAGGIVVDEHMSQRLFVGCSVTRNGKGVSDLQLPIKTAWLDVIEGFSPRLAMAFCEYEVEMAEMAATVSFATIIALAALAENEDLVGERGRYAFRNFARHDMLYGHEEYLPEVFSEAGFVRRTSRRNISEFAFFLDRGMRMLVEHPKSPDSFEFRHDMEIVLRQALDADQLRESRMGSRYLRVLFSMLDDLIVRGPSKRGRKSAFLEWLQGLLGRG